MEVTYIIFNLLELSGLVVFIWYLIKGLNRKIESLQSTVDIQKSTIDAMSQRANEAEKIGELYKKLLNELPEDIEKYKDTLRSLKDSIIRELEEAHARKDAQLEALTKSRLDEIEKQESILDEIPNLRQTIILTYENLESRLEVLDMLQPGTAIGDFLRDAEWALENYRAEHEKPMVDVKQKNHSLTEGDRAQKSEALSDTQV